MRLGIVEHAWVDPLLAMRACASLPGRIFLDSGGEDLQLARWSVLAFDPLESVSAHVGSGRGPGAPAGDPFRPMEELFERWRGSPSTAWGAGGGPAQHGGDAGAGGDRSHPRIPFTGGVIAALGYDLGRALEHRPSTSVDAPAIPDLWAAVYDGAIVFDRMEKRVWATSWGLRGAPSLSDAASVLASARSAAANRPSGMKSGPQRGTDSSPGPGVARVPGPAGVSHWDDPVERTRFLSGVDRIRQEIASGEIYQANLTRRVAHAVPPGAGPKLYEHLRAVSPTPFGAYLDAGEFELLSASPERFVKLGGGMIETRPIKGTRPRGQTREEDERLCAELLRSEKDLAELLMIVDLERNDLGRVCETGSVEVVGLPSLERYSTVWHLVATVRGRIAAGCPVRTILGAVFPGGSITGAPKIRAMELLERLEPHRRKFSMGSLLAWDFSGGIDSSILIRTMTIHRGEMVFHVGGGIVNDSDPEAEYRETVAKAAPLVAALGSL